MEHADRIAQEISFFKDMDLNALPAIYSYWSNKYLTELLNEAYGSFDLFGVFARELGESVRTTGNPTIVSIGSGDAEVECAIAARMLDLGYTDFCFECLELSTFLIDRARERVAGTRLEAHLRFVEIDLTQWAPAAPFGACFANHSLHHIVALEHVFDQIRAHLAPNGSFLTSDMIGRNGHMRWPETLAIIQAIWQVIPDAWKHNRPLKRFEREFGNWDCSNFGFEGVRAQDILPLLVERFHFHKLVAWGGIIDPFVDRAFGHNLDPDIEFDRRFIDQLWKCNRNLVKLGVVKPTQMIAVMKNEPGSLVSFDDLDPASCVRVADALAAKLAPESPQFEPICAETSVADDIPATESSPPPMACAPAAPDSGPDQSLAIHGAHSGTWYDPNRNGEGVQLEIGLLGETRRIIANWQTYRDGRQMWLTGSALLSAGCNSVTVPMFGTDGASFGAAFRAADVRLEPWGNITLRLLGAGRIELSYNGDAGQHGMLTLQRMLDRIEGL